MPDREQLRERQSALLRALTRGGPPPPGFEASRLELTAAGLTRKRLLETGHSLGRLREFMDFEELFAEFAREVPRAATPRLDGYRFCGWLLDRGRAGRAWRGVVARRLALRDSGDDASPCGWPRTFFSWRGWAFYWPGRGVVWLDWPGRNTTIRASTGS